MSDASFIGTWEQTMDSAKTTWLRPDVRGGIYAECWQCHGDDAWFWSAPSVDDDIGEERSLIAAKVACDRKLLGAGYEIPFEKGALP